MVHKAPILVGFLVFTKMQSDSLKVTKFPFSWIVKIIKNHHLQEDNYTKRDNKDASAGILII